MTLSSIEIQSMLPHRFPFLLVDRILEREIGVRAVGIKNVTINEWFFQGHVPGFPIMPGVLIVESLAQTAGFVIIGLPEVEGGFPLFGGIDEFRFRRPVTPGDTLRLETELLSKEGTRFTFYGKAIVGEKVVAEGKITLAGPRR